MIETNPTRRPRPSEEGYILIWIIFLLAVFAIAMTVAAPKVAKDIQLDRERETMERGKQYTRAVQLYYRKFHAFPPNIEALVKTNNIRFLRKKYIDPTTGKDDWKPIRFGQNKTPTAMGFFGQPLAGSASTIAGTGPSGGNQNPGGPFQQAAASSATSDPNNPNGTPGASATAPSTTGLTGQTFGGAGIIGFSPASAKPSILVYKKKSHYNEWEFVYDPLTEMKTISGNTNTGLNPTQTPPTPTPTPAPAPTPTPAPEQ